MTNQADQQKQDYDAPKDEFAGKILDSLSGAFNLAAIHLGGKLGFYGILAGSGGLTAAELASKAATNQRYTREWLEQQSVTGVLTVDGPATVPALRKFSLPAPHAEVLADPDSLDYLAPLAQMFVGVLLPIPALLNAYRTGGGVPYGDYGVDLREGQGAINRPAFLFQLGSE